MATPTPTQAASVLVRMNREGLVMLGITGGLGAGIGALVSHRKLMGAAIGATLGLGLPIVASLLILLPLRNIRVGAPTDAG